MAASVRFVCEGLLESDLRQPETHRWRTGSDNEAPSCKRICRGREDLGFRNGKLVDAELTNQPKRIGMLNLALERRSCTTQGITSRSDHERFSTERDDASLACYGSAPPSYDEALRDAPPDYSGTEALAKVQRDHESLLPPPYDASSIPRNELPLIDDPWLSPRIDFSDFQFRQHAGKKAKQAQKKAQAAKWADSGDEVDKPSGNDEDGGGDGGGTGGGGGGNGDGDDGDWWDAGNDKKKGKKGKKGKNAADEEKEEEERKKKEDEEKKKKKEEEEAAALANDHGISGAGAANPDDEWGFQSTKKGKKGKKGKGPEPVPPPPPPPPAAPKDAIIDAFDDITLDDGAPKLNLDFGATDSKMNGGGIGFGTWGSNWDTGTGNTKTSKNDTDNNPWSFGSGKKKTAKDDGFSAFNFGDMTEQPIVTDAPDKNSIKEDEDWAGLMSQTKKDKKKSKKGADDPLKKEDVVAVPDPIEAAVEEDWGSWDTAKKGKKGKKAAIADTKEDLLKGSTPDDPKVPPTAAAEEEWDSFMTNKKDKKKGKKGAIEEKVEPPKDEVPAVDAGDDGIWGGWATGVKKDKKKGKTAIADPKIIDDIDQIVDLSPAAKAATSATADDDDWNDWSTSKNKKKGKNTTLIGKKPEDLEPLPPPPPPAPPAPAANAEDELSYGASKKDKKKKGRGSTDAAPPSTDPSFTLDEIADPKISVLDDEWGSGWGFSSKQKKKGTKDAAIDVLGDSAAASTLQSNSVIEPKVEDDTWGIWGSAKDKKKGKRGAQDPPPPAPTPPNQGLTPEPTPSPAPVEAGDDEWATFTTSKSKGKKGAKKTAAGPEAAEAKGLKSKPLIRDMHNEDNDIMAIIDEANGATDPILDDLVDLDDGGPEPAAKAAKNFWGGGLGAASTTKTTKEKEKDKKERLKKEKEEKERLEKESKEKEKKEKKEKEEKERKEKEEKDKIVREEKEKKAKEEKEKKAKDDKEKKVKDEKEKKLKEEKERKEREKKEKEEKEKRAKEEKEKKVREEKEKKEKEKEEKEKRAKEEKVKLEKARLEKLSKKSTTKSPPAAKDESAPEGDEIALDKKDSKAKSGPSLSKLDSNKSTKSAKSVGNAMKDIAEEPVVDQPIEKEKRKDDAWSFWGSSRKPTKKPIDMSKKDEGKSKSTNQESSSLADQLSKSPELPSSSSKSKSPPISTKPVSISKASVTDRVKALDKDKSLEPEIDDSSKAEAPQRKPSTLSRSKSTAAKSSVKKQDTDLASRKDKTGKDKKVAGDSSAVPGSFPADGADDDIGDLVDLDTATKTSKKNKKSGRLSDMDPVDKEKAPPAPPQETASAKPVKKERAKIVREESSWGFWGAAPKKDSKAKDRRPKDDSAVPSPNAKTRDSFGALSRSKSTRSPPEKEPEKSSSSSEKDKGVRPPAAPSKSKGMSFSQFLTGGPPPSRTKRQSIGARTGSRRQSIDVDASPTDSPVEDTKARTPNSAKAAKFLGTSPEKAAKLARRESTRSKKGKYPAADAGPSLLDDDIVMVEGEDALIDAPVKAEPTAKAGRNKSKRESKHAQATSDPIFSGADDVVMVDAPGPSRAAPELVQGPGDLAFVEVPRNGDTSLKRSTTNSKKPGMMGLFGSLRAKSRPNPDVDSRRALKGFEDDRKPRRSTKTESDGEALTEAEDVQARREERRAKRAAREAAEQEAREADIREAEARRARRREAEKQALESRKAKAREMRERRLQEEEAKEVQRQEARRARRAAREEQITREEEARKLEEAQEAQRREERRARRREREAAAADVAPVVDEAASRPKRSERRKSHLDKSVPRASEEEEERRLRKEDRRARRATREIPMDRRKSAPGVPVLDYFDPRNGSHRHAPEPEPFAPTQSRSTDPYTNGIHQTGTDHTSSWVNSQIIEPPPPPPVEGTVLDVPPATAKKYDDSTVDEDARRGMRRAGRRRSKYASMSPHEGEERRRKKDVRRAEKGTATPGLRSSEGSSGDGVRRSRRASRRMDSDYVYANEGTGGIRFPDGRPSTANTMNERRGSFWKGLGAKIAGV
ncbi:MAG: hypothetical protein M1837_002661 [Sclerophora amabilis]|nr:MAG: hypothetical protein M1837_002661 [Sclerophora amabilis]